MRELAQIKEAALSALNGAGLRTVSRFPEERARRYAGAVAAVGVGAAEGKTAGFCHYLGERTDPETQTVRERYGKILAGEIIVEIRAERAADCEHGCERAMETLLSGLPEGIQTGTLSWEEIRWETGTEMFVRRGRLECRALFLAECEEEAEKFLDFRLKGVMET